MLESEKEKMISEFESLLETLIHSRACVQITVINFYNRKVAEAEKIFSKDFFRYKIIPTDVEISQEKMIPVDDYSDNTGIGFLSGYTSSSSYLQPKLIRDEISCDILILETKLRDLIKTLKSK